MNWTKLRQEGEFARLRKKKAKKKKQYGLKYVKPGYQIGDKKPIISTKLTPAQRDIAKQYRKELIARATKAEKVLLPLLEPIKGMCFQKVVCFNNKFYFPDFTFSLSKGNRLYVEIDGGYHDTPEQQEKDSERTEILCRTGDKLIRFSNEEVLSEPETVVIKILKEIHSRLIVE